MVHRVGRYVLQSRTRLVCFLSFVSVLLLLQKESGVELERRLQNDGVGTTFGRVEQSGNGMIAMQQFHDDHSLKACFAP